VATVLISTHKIGETTQGVPLYFKKWGVCPPVRPFMDLRLCSDTHF